MVKILYSYRRASPYNFWTFTWLLYQTDGDRHWVSTSNRMKTITCLHHSTDGIITRLLQRNTNHYTIQMRILTGSLNHRDNASSHGTYNILKMNRHCCTLPYRRCIITWYIQYTEGNSSLVYIFMQTEIYYWVTKSLQTRNNLFFCLE